MSAMPQYLFGVTFNAFWYAFRRELRRFELQRTNLLRLSTQELRSASRYD